MIWMEGGLHQVRNWDETSYLPVGAVPSFGGDSVNAETVPGMNAGKAFKSSSRLCFTYMSQVTELESHPLNSSSNANTPSINLQKPARHKFRIITRQKRHHARDV